MKAKRLALCAVPLFFVIALALTYGVLAGYAQEPTATPPPTEDATMTSTAAPASPFDYSAVESRSGIIQPDTRDLNMYHLFEEASTVGLVGQEPGEAVCAIIPVDYGPRSVSWLDVPACATYGTNLRVACLNKRGELSTGSVGPLNFDDDMLTFMSRQDGHCVLLGFAPLGDGETDTDGTPGDTTATPTPTPAVTEEMGTSTPLPTATEDMTMTPTPEPIDSDATSTPTP